MPVIKLTREVKVEFEDELTLIPIGTIGELDDYLSMADFLVDETWYQWVSVEEGDYTLLKTMCDDCDGEGYIDWDEGSREPILCSECKGWGWK